MVSSLLSTKRVRRAFLYFYTSIWKLKPYPIYGITEDSTKRVSLSCVPMSGNWLLGPSDIDELLFMLQDSPVNEMEDRNQMNQALMARYRPSRVRAMFASRACRKAVMVGDPLTLTRMTNLLRQLGELQQPWVLRIQFELVVFLFNWIYIRTAHTDGQPWDI